MNTRWHRPSCIAIDAMARITHRQQSGILASYCNRLYKQGLVGSAEGNLSLKLPNGDILITPAGIDKARVTGSDIIKISLDGIVLAGKHKPSSEYRLHLEIYKSRPEIKAICHAHPIYATSFAVAGTPLDKVILPEVTATIGLIPISVYTIPGSLELALKVAKLSKNFNSILIRNHGVVTVGENSEEAFRRMELTERYAQIYYLATKIGGAHAWPQKILKRLPGIDRVKKQAALIKSSQGYELK